MTDEEIALAIRRGVIKRFAGGGLYNLRYWARVFENRIVPFEEHDASALILMDHLAMSLAHLAGTTITTENVLANKLYILGLLQDLILVNEMKHG